MDHYTLPASNNQYLLFEILTRVRESISYLVTNNRNLLVNVNLVKVQEILCTIYEAIRVINSVQTLSAHVSLPLLPGDIVDRGHQGGEGDLLLCVTLPCLTILVVFCSYLLNW